MQCVLYKEECHTPWRGPSMPWANLSQEATIPRRALLGDQEWEADLDNHPDASPLHRSVYCHTRSSHPARDPCYSHHLCCKHCTWPGGTVGGRDSECTYASRPLLSLCIRSAIHRHKNKAPSTSGWREKALTAHWKDWLFVESLISSFFLYGSCYVA